jgi:hypothetical protein
LYTNKDNLYNCIEKKERNSCHFQAMIADVLSAEKKITVLLYKAEK